MDTATATPPRLLPPQPANGPDPIDAHVGRRIDEARIERGMSQAQLGDAIGVSFQQVQKYSKGANRVSASMLYRIADALGVSVVYFFAGLGKTEAEEIDPRNHQALAIARYYRAITNVEARRHLMGLARFLAREGNHADATD